MTESLFGSNEPQDTIGFLLWQTTITWQRSIRKTLEEYEINHPQFIIMSLLSWFETHGEKNNQASIIKYSKLDKMTVSKSLEKLSNLSYVSRQGDSIDTRSKKVFLTVEGKRLINRITPKISEIDKSYFSILTQEQQEELKNFLKKVVR